MNGQQLKNSILKLAIQGKLVPQDSSDEPASVLLSRIREEKKKLVEEKKIKKDKPLASIKDEEKPFEIPESWEWVRLGQCSTYSCSKEKISAKDISPDMWSLDLEDIEKETGKILQYTKASERKITGDKVVFHKDQILYSKLRPYLKKILIAPNDGIATPELVPFDLIGGILPEYMLYVLKCPHIDFVINTVTYGVKMPRVGTETMVSLLIPLPPIKEQLRIVNKINDLMPMVMLYGETQAEIDNYNATFPAILKKSILQFAIQGKLVEQSSSDEPASILLQRIQEEKDALIKAGKIKQDKNESTIYRRDNSYYEKIGHEERCIDDEIPFDIPETWEWTRLNNLVYFIGGYAYKSNEFIDASKYQVLRLGNVKNNCLKLETKPVFITEELAEQTKGFLCKQNDILITMTGTRGKRDYFFSVKIDDSNTNFYINQRVGCLRAFLPHLSNWLIWVLKSETVLNQVFQHETGTANQGNLGAENIMKTLIPLPPENEQIQIIEKLYQISYFLQDK